MKAIRNEYKMLVKRPEGKRPLGRSRHRWEYNIKMDLVEIQWEAWIGFIWFRIDTDVGLL
jgi:hypothetical protein